MEKGFSFCESVVIPFDRSNVDTDMLLPKQFLQKINKIGFGQHLFHELRYLDDEGTIENPDFILNQEPYKTANILLSRDNFGCGSSREHAPWAIKDFGINIILASSYADIFYNNCFNNQILPIILSEEVIEQIFNLLIKDPFNKMLIDVEQQVINYANNSFTFNIEEMKKLRIIKGLDEIGLTLLYEDKISEYESKIPKFLR